MYPVKSGIGWVISILRSQALSKMIVDDDIPSLGIVRIGICVIEPFLP